jgi:cell division transport system permease protein
VSAETKKIRRKRPSSFPSVISMAMVLFLLGLLGLLVIYAKKTSDQWKESIQVAIYLRAGATEKDALELKMQLDKEAYTKEARYVSKEEAAEKMKAELGQDFEAVLGYNPMPYSIELFINSSFATKNTLALIKGKLLQNPQVEEVSYKDFVLENLESNIREIAIGLIVLSIVFMIISITIINSTIRLGIFARRFLIKSMQFVGATEWFIMRPFIGRAMLHGFYGFIIAVGLLAGLVIGILKYDPAYHVMIDYFLFAVLLAGLLVLGLLISLISSILITRKYLHTRIDDLY